MLILYCVCVFKSLRGESIGFIGKWFPSAVVSVTQRVLVDFFVIFVVTGCGGVVLVSCRFGEGLLRGCVRPSVAFWGICFFVLLVCVVKCHIPRLSVGFGLPLDRFQLCGFAFLFFFVKSASFLACYSFGDNLFGIPVFSSSRNFSCCGAFGCSKSTKRKHGPVLLADLYPTKSTSRENLHGS